MPCASPDCAGSSRSVSEMKGMTAAKAYQSAARKISQVSASAKMPACQRLTRDLSVSESVSQFILRSPVPDGCSTMRLCGAPLLVACPLRPETGGSRTSERRRQEIDFVLCGDAHHLGRVADI